VKMPRTPQAYRALDAYRDAPRGDRFHVKIRWLTCPVAAVEKQVPRSGRILDVGCGHGLVSLYMAVCSEDRDIVGVDIDKHKIALAQQAAPYIGTNDGEGGAGSVEFHAVDPGVLPDGPFDAVTINDVLYLLGPDLRRSIIDACIDRLAPGGTILIKETDTVPRWKAWIAELQEVVATKVTRITEGDEIDYASAAEFVGQLEERGLVARTVRLDKGYIHPHVLVMGRKR
jgi:2-polyprenyl-3-methyl-5-hydroxy-6-metoxy-1,4-benzoquinol methylase